jgi:hypothetical protein
MCGDNSKSKLDFGTLIRLIDSEDIKNVHANRILQFKTNTIIIWNWRERYMMIIYDDDI